MELFAKIDYSWTLLAIFPNGPILDVWQGYEYVSDGSLL